MDPAGFYGVAGQAVRLIEPHTEADPAALLVQILVAFGSMIGRCTFMKADGCEHHFNLFVTLVGDSSKGRKGTSWSQVRRLMSKIDTTWAHDCLKNGLVSGEGLIHHVRDPVTEKKPSKGGGAAGQEPELVITDPGVADKRLCAMEPEFARVLKAMGRDGNTLSTILRPAWDGDDLRTLAKNVHERATAPHISLIAHTTREDVRRFLTETEVANGFANRLLWVAVSRSKYLSEGGNIDLVDFSTVEKGLTGALRFAGTAGELKRDEETARLWSQDYRQLSDGKHGMVGAVTGRAEAQVMRLSGLFALLDQSNVIRVEHHRAAMAVWQYCERSAHWIFGGATGDRNADKILKALQRAGEAGMPQTAIQQNVFNKNLPACDLHEALLKLVELELATSKQVKGAGPGAATTWWFAVTGQTNLTNLTKGFQTVPA